MPTEKDSTLKDQLTERAQLVRIYEASCGLQYPSDEEKNFRAAIMKKLGLAYGLREVKAMTVTAPSRN